MAELTLVDFVYEVDQLCHRCVGKRIAQPIDELPSPLWRPGVGRENGEDRSVGLDDGIVGIAVC